MPPNVLAKKEKEGHFPLPENAIFISFSGIFMPSHESWTWVLRGAGWWNRWKCSISTPQRAAVLSQASTQSYWGYEKMLENCLIMLPYHHMRSALLHSSSLKYLKGEKCNNFQLQLFFKYFPPTKAERHSIFGHVRVLWNSAWSSLLISSYCLDIVILSKKYIWTTPSS